MRRGGGRRKRWDREWGVIALEKSFVETHVYETFRPFQINMCAMMREPSRAETIEHHSLALAAEKGERARAHHACALLKGLGP